MKKIRNTVVLFLTCVTLFGCNTRTDINSTECTRLPESSIVTSEVNAVSDNCNAPACIVPILMFHDVKTEEGGTWSISADNFRNILVFLLENGYSPISFDELISYADGLGGIPEKPVCITLDDGYFSNYRNVLPIITELDIPITVFMTCKTVRREGVTVGNDENDLQKMSMAELRIMASSPLVSIQSHSYALHGMNTSYSDEKRDNALPIEGEDKHQYETLFVEDCIAAEDILKKIGNKDITVFSYPCGKYHAWTEELLRDRGYRVSLTTDYDKVNLVFRGNPDSLYLLGRMNVNDETTEAKLLAYLER